MKYEFLCETCEENGVEDPWHEGELAHKDQWNGKQLYEIICFDGLSEWVNLEWIHRPARPKFKLVP